jgi:abortive infection bacteriophage resistance protein
MEILRAHGCTVSDEARCEEILSQVGYYRLSAYFLPFKTADGTYKNGTDFQKVYRLYEFDRRLRRLVFSALEELEVFLRSQLTYFHTHKYGADGYLNPANFNDRHDHARFTERMNDLLKSNGKLAFVKHHRNKYEGLFPLWVIAELFTFGMLSYFYADLITADQKNIAYGVFNTTVPNAKSWLYCCTDLRNLCAHSGRLYYSVFSAVPAKLPGVERRAENSLFAALMALRALYPSANKWNAEILTALIALIDEYQEDIELRHIGFPVEWEPVMRKQP